MSRPNIQQLEALTEFLVDNPGIAKGLLRTAQAKQETKRKWDGISINLNALGGAQKDGRGWAKYWADKKCALKKICAQHARSLRRTGGGPAEALPALTSIDQRLVAVMGGMQFAVGDSHLAVDPFPEPTVPVSSDSLHLLPQISSPNIGTNFEAVEIIPIETVASSHSAEVQPTEEPTGHASPRVTGRDRSPHDSAPPPSTSRPPRQRPRSSQDHLREDRQLFASIEQKRVDAEAVTAMALKNAAENIGLIAAAINNLAKSITEASKNICDSINAAATKSST